MLVGNKIDLHQERTVSTEEGKKLAESWRAAFLETSAKQNEVNYNSIICILYSVDDICFINILYFKSVADIFHQLLLLIENENGNPQEKSGCVIS